MSQNDTQVGGNHYLSRDVQPWQAMEAWMPREAFTGFLEGNCIKCLARWRLKGGVQDLEKARHYLGKLIEVEDEVPSCATCKHGHTARSADPCDRCDGLALWEVRA